MLKRALSYYYMVARAVNMSHNNVPYMYMKCAFQLVFALTVSNIEHKFQLCARLQTMAESADALNLRGTFSHTQTHTHTYLSTTHTDYRAMNI